MTGYKPQKIAFQSAGLITNREKFLLPTDAFVQLINAYVWREKVRRKSGFSKLGRLQRNLDTPETLSTQASGTSYTNSDVLADASYGLRSSQPNAQIVPGSVSITVDTYSFTDDGFGNLTATGASGTINYNTGALELTFDVALGSATDVDVTLSYYPMLPVMGICNRTQDAINSATPIVFDTKYAYDFNSGTMQFEEFIPGTEWSGLDYNFFWSTNWWVNSTNASIFWVTNYSGTGGDPIRYTDGTTWTDFTPQINASSDVLAQSLMLLPFRGRLLAINTYEGSSLAASKPYQQRIRWSAIGSPFTSDAWRDDITGQGGFLDIPTAEVITAAGFVRDNLVIYCEQSTWQLRYTGRTINPFQIEKVNTELGSNSTFSAIPFDTSLMGIGDKGIVSCDSFKSERVDIKIVDFFLEINNLNQGVYRVAGIRDFVNKLAYWIYPNQTSTKYPNNRLVYNYENDSWAIFTDSLTALGPYQPQDSLTWENSTTTWEESNFTWQGNQALQQQIIGGNQQGYVLVLDQQTSNAASLSITDISTVSTNLLTVPDHNLQTGQVIEVVNIPTGTPGESLNGLKFGIVLSTLDPDNQFYIYEYNELTDAFDIIPTNEMSSSYIGGGEIRVREGFSIWSKSFEFMDMGQNIQMGWVDALLDTTEAGQVTFKVYQNYDSTSAVNNYPENISSVTGVTDQFFNSLVPTYAPTGTLQNSSKTWQRVFCPTRANFISFEWTLSNSQLVRNEQEEDFQLSAQVLWVRPAGRMTAC